MRSKLPILLACLALAGTACGTRLSNGEFAAKAGLGNNGRAASSGLALGDQSAPTDQSGGTTGGQAGTAGSSTAGSAGGAAAGAAGTRAGGAAGPVAAGANTASDVGVTPTSITLGNVTAIQGQFGPDAFSPSLYGLQAYVAALNARGGVNGRKIDFKTCDDRDTGDGNLACSKQLVEQQKVFAFLANNSQSSARSASYTNSKGVPDLGLPLNNGYYKYPTMFSFYGNSPYPRNGTVGLGGTLYQPSGAYRWFKQQRHVDKGAFFFYTIPVSQQQGYASEELAKAEGIQQAYEGGGSHNGENVAAPTFDTDVVNMKNAGVQGIWDAMDEGANEKLCNAMDRGSFKVIAKVSTIEVWGQKVGSNFSSPCRNSVYANGVSEPYSDKGNPLVAQFLSDFAKYSPGRQMHQWNLEGWAMGYEFTKAVETMGPTVTRAGFMKWLNGLSAYTLDGLRDPFDYKLRDVKAPVHDCFSIAHWQDSASTFVTEAPVTTCYNDAKWVGYTPTDDGA